MILKAPCFWVGSRFGASYPNYHVPKSLPSNDRACNRRRRGGAREAVANLHERGEKLETLKSAVDGLAAEAEAFAAGAHRLNK